jgi:hypothetical protein
MDNSLAPTFQDIVDIHTKMSELRWQYWTENTVFSFEWWLLIIALISAWVVWWRLVDRRRTTEILLYGMFIFVVAIELDVIGGELGLWDYPAMVIPWGARLVCIDALIPVIYMLIYQYFPPWKSFILANTIMAFVFAFMAEPLLVWLNIYEPLTWRHIYSFPIYILIAIVFKWLVEKITKTEVDTPV